MNRDLYRIVSYFVVFCLIKKLDCLDIQYQLTDELQRVLNEDSVLLEQQIETVKLDELCQSLQTISNCVEKSLAKNKIFQLSCFHGVNAFFGRILFVSN